MSPINYEELWRCVQNLFPLSIKSIHGPDHWRRVERNGLFLAQYEPVDVTVVRLFALFHDSQRKNDHRDPEHGARGAQLAVDLHGRYFRLSNSQMTLLLTACGHHTAQTHHDDPTIGACWDADRLDLKRVMIEPDPDYLNTKTAQQIACSGEFWRLARFKFC